MEIIDYKKAVQLHIDKFGVEPVITGINFWESDKTLERILESIEKGDPYVEDEVPPGASIILNC